MLKSPTKIEYEFSLLNACSDGVISSMKHEMFWLLLLSLGGLYIFPNVILFIMFSPAMSINRPSQIVESLYRSLRNVWVYRLFKYITNPP